MQYLILSPWIALCCVFSAQAVNGADPPVDAVAVAYSRVSADLSVLAKAQGDVAALSKANERLAASQASLVASKAALVAAIDAAAANLPVVPPVVKVVRLVAILSPGCPACQIISPILTKLQGEGLLIEVTSDPADALKYQALDFPTLIMVVDDIGKSRTAKGKGNLNEQQICEWYLSTVEWARKTK
jgi:thiol-disulfide isomerase/thioredoxin